MSLTHAIIATIQARFRLGFNLKLLNHDSSYDSRSYGLINLSAGKPVLNGLIDVVLVNKSYW